MATSDGPSDNYVVIFRPFITLKNGRRIYARWYGKKAFPIRVKINK